MMLSGIVFPTPVGMNRIMAPDMGTLARVPHTRGDEPAPVRSCEWP